MGRFVRSTKSVFLSLLLLTSFGGCKEGDSVDTGGTNVIVAPPKDDPSQVVCNPLSGSGSDLPSSGTNLPSSGLLADLYYLSDDQPRYSSVDDLIANGHALSDFSLYFDRLFIPTRPFDRGFITQAGETIKNLNGNTLYEYFALHLEAKLRLAEGDSPGAYQFGILADDGAKMHVDDQGTGFYNLVNNDGVHPTKFKCASTPVFLDQNSAIPMKLDYHQGPRFHVALVLMWRPWPASGSVIDPECDQSGNSRYFDSTQDPPAPTSTYLNMASRGWMPLQTGNFALPVSAPNPCQQEDPLVLSDIAVTDRTQTTAVLQWTTNVAANSEGSLTMVANGTKINVAPESTMVTSHALAVTGLTADTLYSFEVVSTTAGGQTAKSDPRTFRTLR